MTASASAITSDSLLASAVHRHRPWTPQGLLERAFTRAFRDLVYAQIWEDPIVDMEALEIGPTSEVVGIASGGCNLLSYLSANPARVYGVDLNAAHVALNRLKIAAVTTMPDYATYYRFVGRANDTSNIADFDRYIAPMLDAASADYWNGRDWQGRRRISVFGRNLYKAGLLGHFIRLGHFAARRYGVDMKALLSNTTRAEMLAAFETQIAPLFEKRLIKTMLDSPVSLYGLGIPPSQYAELGSSGEPMTAIVRERLRKLLCDFDLTDNYFAHQALARCYQPDGAGALPPYLQRAHFDAVRERAGRISVQQISMTAFLAARPNRSLDRYILLDAQDWMTTEQLNALWIEITRTARPGSRVIFRTAGKTSPLPGRVDAHLLQRWNYEQCRSAELFVRDRSAIYGGFHLYTWRGHE